MLVFMRLKASAGESILCVEPTIISRDTARAVIKDIDWKTELV